MALTIVTSCSTAGYTQYGQKFLTSFDQFWPLDVKLNIVSEDRLDLPESILRKRPLIKFWDLNSSKPAVAFWEKHKDNPVTHGFRKGTEIAHFRSKKTGYDYRKDAFRFSKKVFALNLVLPYVTDSDHMVWLDADTITLKPVPETIFDGLPPSTAALAYIDRHPYHSECGVVAYNMRHLLTRPFLREFSRIYESGEIFELPEWHDSYVFDWIRKRKAIPSFKITYDHRHITHPFGYTKLGEYMDHLKGMRKEKGCSHDHPRFNQHHRQQDRRPRANVSNRDRYAQRYPQRTS
jgi:hypothetical protein